MAVVILDVADREHLSLSNSLYGALSEWVTNQTADALLREKVEIAQWNYLLDLAEFSGQQRQELGAHVLALRENIEAERGAMGTPALLQHLEQVARFIQSQ
ncbi:hypothetical protein [Deinococcus arcticus]|uniref:Uncharacterized protein n=1 Tax=Deinococcus arcticus TaxID=2136176 RepID=A0A2T3WAW3_9DEIO|nr:hypothetical protein [Deinococcus arcticus]PTA68972.1 hypothetical protein C8263_04005 [Deinococcus arcticus]